MIGDPYNFSIWANVVKEWNVDDTFCNGILIFSIDGILYPGEIISATLACEIPHLREKLRAIPVNESIYGLQKEDAFTWIYNTTFPEDICVDNDYSYDISPESFSDNNYFVFAVSNGENIRILGAKLEYDLTESRHNLANMDVREAFVNTEEMKTIADGLVF